MIIATITAAITKAMAGYGLRIALVAGLAVTAFAWDRSRIQVGVEKERARVEKEGIKIDAKASIARRDAERDASRRLQHYFRD